MYPEVGLLGHMVALFKIFEKPLYCFYIVAALDPSKISGNPECLLLGLWTLRTAGSSANCGCEEGGAI